jgi:Domain of unknown function (DUF4328)
MPEFNPYESPQAIESPGTQQYAWSRNEFVSAHTRAVFAMALLGIMVVLSFGNIFSNWLQYDLLSQVKHGKQFSPEALQANDTRHAIIVLVELFGFVLTAIAFLMWTHRAYRNLPALGARNLETSPGWAVGWYFVPIANLVKPYSATVEIVRHSDPDGIGVNARASSTAIVGFWWAAYLISGVIAWFAGMTLASGIQARSIDGMMSGVAIAMLAILLISRVDNDQPKRIERIRNQEAHQAPSEQLPSWL